MSSAAAVPVPVARSGRTVRRVAIIALVWFVVAVVFVTQNYLGVVTRHEKPRWLFVAGLEFEYWLTFFAFTPFFAFMARRFPVGGVRTASALWAHAIGGVVFALVQPVASDALQYVTLALVSGTGNPPEGRLAGMVARYPVLAVIALWKYVVIIGVYHAIDYYRKYREHELRAAQLESRLAAAQVGALRMQLQPHFLFNALNSAAALTLSEPARAHDVLAQLGALLRETLDSGADADVTLAREVDFVDRYLAIERVRFEERLAVRFEIPEDVRDALVPSLILQPLVENAIHHALAPLASARTLIIRAGTQGDLLHLDVEDDGPGLPPNWTFSESARTGLANVQARVNLAGEVHRPIEFRSQHGQGLCVRITLPLRRAGGTAR
jgi:two-component system LytT family sensor kinase